MVMKVCSWRRKAALLIYNLEGNATRLVRCAEPCARCQNCKALPQNLCDWYGVSLPVFHRRCRKTAAQIACLFCGAVLSGVSNVVTSVNITQITLSMARRRTKSARLIGTATAVTFRCFTAYLSACSSGACGFDKTLEVRIFAEKHFAAFPNIIT